MAEQTTPQPAVKQPKKQKKSLLSSLFPKANGSSSADSRKISASTQKFLKIKGIRDGVVELEDGGYRAIIMASSINFALMAEEEQNAILSGYQGFLNSLEFPVQILVQSRILNITSYLEKLSDLEKMQENQLLRMQIGEYKEYIKSLIEFANITTNQYYVVVSYAGGKGLGKDSIVQRAKKAISPAKGVQVNIESYDKAARELQIRVNSVLGGLRGMGIRADMINTQEVVELFYSTFNPEISGTQVLADLERINVET